MDDTHPVHATPLAAFAVTPEQSGGREYPEAPPAFRSEFQRDRDRIIHCSAFRRLEYKTQVFVNHEGDMFRTRLTHSLEVAQIARTIARALQLNEDLTETIALAHDLGHTPFGHAGQTALNDCMTQFGGFEHNFQSLRVVCTLEDRYPDFPGLNLLFASREGILKHCSAERAATIGELGRRFIERTQPSLEAQLANVADEIAYNHHDIDDGLRADLLRHDSLLELRLFRETYERASRRWRDLGAKRILYTVIREMVNYFVTDMIRATRARLDELAPRTLADIRAAGRPLVDFSSAVRQDHLDLKRVLRRDLYHHERVLENAANARTVVRRLFEAYHSDPSMLPDERGSGIADGNETDRAQAAADYIAGMTDRFAIGEYRRLFGRDEFRTQ